MECRYITLQDICKKMESKKSTVDTYIAARVFVPQRKDKKNKRTNEFIEECVDVQIYFHKELLNRGKSKVEIGKIFRQVFGERDEALVEELKKAKTTEETIEHFMGIVLV